MRPIRGVAHAATIAALLLTYTRTICAQELPPPPPGVVVQMPDKPDPSVKIPQFEVISVKPSKGNETRIQITPDGLRGTEVTTRFLLMEAFGGINQNQLIGEPSWATTDGFDLEAKVDAADLPTMAKLTFDQRRTMFQQILTDRYKLVFHHETRALPVYRLVLGKNGSKLKPAAPGDAAPAANHRRGVMFGPGEVTVIDDSVAMLVMPLSRLLGRVVVDSTGLNGSYNFTLKWTPEGSAAPAPADAPSNATSSADIFTAIQEQLGLKLEAAKAPVDVVVIDRIEKPSAN